MLEEIFQLVLTIVTPIVAILAGYVAKRVKDYIDKKIANEQVNEWLDSVVDAVEDAVYLTAQEYTSALKKQQGSLTESQQLIALQKAKDKFYAEIDETGKELLVQLYGNVDSWLEKRIDIILGQSKL